MAGDLLISGASESSQRRDMQRPTQWGQQGQFAQQAAHGVKTAQGVAIRQVQMQRGQAIGFTQPRCERLDGSAIVQINEGEAATPIQRCGDAARSLADGALAIVNGEQSTLAGAQYAPRCNRTCGSVIIKICTSIVSDQFSM